MNVPSSELVLEPSDDDDGRFVLVQDFEYHGSRGCYFVPAGFSTDFASIPRILWPIIGPPYGRHSKAAVVHDWLYSTEHVTRARADRAFRDIMRECGVGFLRRWVMWLGVRVGGWLSWGKFRKR